MPIKNEVAKVHLVTCIADALKGSIGAVQGGQWLCSSSITTSESQINNEKDESVVVRIQLRGTLHGQVGIEIKHCDVSSLLGINDPEPLKKAWRHVMEGLVQRLPKRALDAGIFAFSVGSYDFGKTLEGSVQIGRLELGQVERTGWVLHVLADYELAESFRAAEWNESRGTTQGRLEHPVTPELERVIDVPLRVTLRFGQRSMRLREVLELNTGAIVELDRQVEDPVDLILDERVIARGEVVIVDGNYGLRVTEIVERPSSVAF